MKLLVLFLFMTISLIAQERLDKVSIQLNWKYQFQFAGFIVAKEKGYYKDIGFDVELKEFTNSTKSIQDMLDSKTNFLISNNLYFKERQKYDIVLLANYLKQSPHVLVTNKSIVHPKDIEDKTLMSSKERLLYTPIDFMFRHLGINDKKIIFKENNYNIGTLIKKKIDAMEVYKTNELYKLSQLNIPYNILDPRDYGFNSGAVNMFTLQKNIDKYGDTRIKAFIDATNKGWKYSLENSDEVVKLIHTKYNTSLNKSVGALEFEAEELKKLFLLDQFKIGELNKKEIYKWSEIYYSYGLIDNISRYNSFLFNTQWREKVYTSNELYIVIASILLIISFLLSKHYVLKKTNKDLQKLQLVIKEKSKALEENLVIMSRYIIFSRTDLKGVITEVSDAFCEISKYSREELVGKPHNIVRHEDMPAEAFVDMWKTIKGGKVWQSEVKNRKKDGGYYWVYAHISPEYGGDGKHCGYVAVRHDITNKKLIEEIAITDGLTSLYNRRHFDSIFSQQIEICKREKFLLAFVIIDIDYFKQYNDIYGHQEGDEVLKSVSKVFKANLRRPDDYSFRLGGEEFALLYHAKNDLDASKLSEKVRIDVESLEIEHTGNKVSNFLTISSGISIIDENVRYSSQEIYKTTDEALYKAKHTGRNKTCMVEF
ncbi:MAG: diguanylate cyclase [Sulfurimonas sp.]|nr:diguanylate cyclase [Sulfurimonas sp.]